MPDKKHTQEDAEHSRWEKLKMRLTMFASEEDENIRFSMLDHHLVRARNKLMFKRIIKTE